MRSGDGAELAAAVDALLAVPACDRSVPDLQATVAAALGLTDRLAGYVDACLGELASRTGGQVPAAPDDTAPTDGPHEAAPDRPAVPLHSWLRDRTGCGGVAAGARVRLALRLHKLPAVLEAVLDGRLGRAQAEVLVRLVDSFSDEQLREAQAGLVQVATDRDPQSLAHWVRELIATHCEPELDADERTASAKRYWQTRRDQALLRGSFAVPLGDAEQILTVIEALARRTGLDDSRSAAQRRADALLDTFDQVLRHSDLPDHGGHRPQLSYVVPAPWAAGQPAPTLADTIAAELAPDPTPSPADAAHPSGHGSDPCPADPDHDHDGRPTAGGTTEHAGSPASAPGGRARQTCATAAWTGPQTRSRIEALLCDARITRVLLDPLGQVTGLHTLNDQITRAQRRALAARDLGCAARGCTRPPATCDAHHLLHRADGGATTLDNLILLCRRHHVLWHQGRLTLRQLHVPWLTAHAARQTGPHAPPQDPLRPDSSPLSA